MTVPIVVALLMIAAVLVLLMPVVYVCSFEYSPPRPPIKHASPSTEPSNGTFTTAAGRELQIQFNGERYRVWDIRPMAWQWTADYETYEEAQDQLNRIAKRDAAQAKPWVPVDTRSNTNG